MDNPATVRMSAKPVVINSSENDSAIDEKPILVMSPMPEMTKASR
jgi:hypothetical protein